MKIGNLEVYGVIYKITNKVNGKVYIGQTSQKRGFKGRYECEGEGIARVYNFHKKAKERGDSYNNHLLSSIEKRGFDNFDVEEIFDYAFSEEELDKKEIIYIWKYKSNNKDFGYNTLEGGKNTYFKKEECANAFFEFKKELFTKTGYGQGIPVYVEETDESFFKYTDLYDKYGDIHLTKNKILKNKNGFVTSKGRVKIRLINGTEFSQPVICLNDLIIFKHQNDASKYYNISSKYIYDVCRGEKGWKKHGNRKLYFIFAGDVYANLETVTSEDNVDKIISNYIDYKYSDGNSAKDKRLSFLNKNKGVVLTMVDNKYSFKDIALEMDKMFNHNRIKIREKHIIEFYHNIN